MSLSRWLGLGSLEYGWGEHWVCWPELGKF